MADRINGGRRARFFISLVQAARMIPSFRGRNRALFALFRFLGLQSQHVRLQVTLQQPLPFEATLDLHSWMQRVAFLDHGYEPDTSSFLARLWESGRGAALDVGANIGLIAIPLARLIASRNGSVIAIEALPDNVAVLQANGEANRLPNLMVIPKGVGSAAATVSIQAEGDLLAGGGTGTANILPQDSTYACVRQEIEITTLDALSEEGTFRANRVSVVKIDTDGYDLKVLEGGTSFLAAHRPVIFGEFAAHCLAWHGQSLDDIRAFAERHRYEVWFREGRSWQFTIAPAVPFVQDLLLVPVEAAAQFAWCRGDQVTSSRPSMP